MLAGFEAEALHAHLPTCQSGVRHTWVFVLSLIGISSVTLGTYFDISVSSSEIGLNLEV